MTHHFDVFVVRQNNKWNCFYKSVRISYSHFLGFWLKSTALEESLRENDLKMPNTMKKKPVSASEQFCLCLCVNSRVLFGILFLPPHTLCSLHVFQRVYILLLPTLFFTFHKKTFQILLTRCRWTLKAICLKMFNSNFKKLIITYSFKIKFIK